MCSAGVSFVTFCALFGIIGVYGTRRGMIILPPNPLGPEAPVCTSYSGLCHLAYNLTDIGSYQVWHSDQQICKCPNNQHCNTEWFNDANAVSFILKMAGREIEMKVSYCELHQPDNVCRQNEVALVTRGGRGPFQFELASDFACRCYRNLYAHRSWRDGDYDYIEYSCGKPRCGMNHFPSTECTRITYNGTPNNLIHEYMCRCRRHEECNAGALPTANNPVVIHSCERVPSSERRRRRRQPHRRF